MNQINDRMISIKEEEAIQQILQELTNYENMPQLDLDIHQLLALEEQKIKDEYDLMAQQRSQNNRNAINIDWNPTLYNLQQKEKMSSDQEEQRSEQPQEEKKHELETNKKIKQKKQHILQVFERDQLQKTKIREQQIMELDSKYPKINYMGMYNHHYQIFESGVSSSAKWFFVKKKPLSCIRQAITFNIFNNQWNLFNLGQQLIVFVGQNWIEPLQIMPPKGKQILKICKSPFNNFVALALQHQILIYSIKKQTIVFFKIISDLEVQSISHINFYSDTPIKICFIDNYENVGLLTVQQTLIFTRVKVHQMEHQLNMVMDLDITKYQNQTLLAMASRNNLCVYSTQPNTQLMCFEKIVKPNLKEVSVRWRTSPIKLFKPQLFLAAGNHVYIYKLCDGDNEENKKLIMNLIFHNHYQITVMEIITNTHLLLQSAQNLTVVAIPLIPSCQNNDQNMDNYQCFQSAMVYVMSRPQLNLLAYSAQSILFYVGESKLQSARLKSLQQQIEQLMIVQSCYREAFSLLILISKGLNYSFKFSYSQSDLANTISYAIHCAIDTLLSATQKYIIMFRTGWVCQLAIQSNLQSFIWTIVFKKMQQIKHQSVLFDILQIFILRQQLHSIPEEAFYSMIGYNCDLGRDGLVQRIILDNPDSYDSIKLIGILHSRKMYYLQCYLFSKGIISDQIDYYTPFLKIYSAFKEKKEDHTGFACLWLIRKCFLLEQIPTGQMSKEQKNEVATSFIIQVLYKSIIKTLCAFNEHLVLQIFILPIVQPQLRSIIEENNQKLIHQYNEYNQPITQKKFIDVIVLTLQQLITSKSSLIWNQFHALSFYYGCQVSFDTLTDILIIFFENKANNYLLEFPQGCDIPSFEQLLVRIVEQIRPQLQNKKNRVHLNKLLSFEESAVSYLFYAIDRNYKMAIQNFLRIKPRDQVFGFVRELVKQIWQFQQTIKQKKLKDVKDYLSKHISTIFQINSSQALNTYYQLGFSSQAIYLILEKNLYPKIDFLTAVLDKFKNQQFQMKQQYLLQHFSEVCQLPKDRMLEYIDRFYYPLEEVIIISQQKGNFLAKAIFQQRNGRPEDAFKSYQRLIRNKVQAGVGKPSQVRKQVQQYVEKCIKICKQHSGSHDGDNFWLKIIRFLSSYVQSQHRHKVYLKVQFQKLQQYVLTEMFVFLPTTLLIDFFSRKDTNLDLNIGRELQIYEQIFILVKFDISMIHRVNRLCKLDLTEQKKSHHLIHKKGFFSNAICSFCCGELQQQHKSRVYWCKHSFHNYCHDDESKCLSCYYQSEDSILSNVLFSSKKQKNPNVVAQNKNKINIDDIVVESLYAAKIEQRKKKLKIYDFQNNNLTDKYFQQFFC